MVIYSDKDYVCGKPCIEGTRLWVGLVIEKIDSSSLEEFLEDYSLENKREKIKKAVEYCMAESCKEKVVAYCLYCNKNKEDPGNDLWKVAKKIYNTYFVDNS